MNSAELKKVLSSSKNLIDRWNVKYIDEISKLIDEQILTLDYIRNNFEKLKTDYNFSDDKARVAIVKGIHEFHSSNLEKLKSLYPGIKNNEETAEFIDNFRSIIFEDIEKLEEVVVDEYHVDKTYPEQGIGSNRFLRKTGNFFYYFRSTPRIVRNGLAWVIRKPAKPLKTRYHNIYYQLIVKGYLLNEYIDHIAGITYEIQKVIINYAHSLFQLESKLIDIDYKANEEVILKEEFPSIDHQILNIKSFFNAYEKTLKTLFEKSGTWEFPSYIIRNKVKKNIKRTSNSVESAYKLWNTTFYAFYEDWRFREEVFSFISLTKILGLQTANSYSAKLENTIKPVIQSKREYLEDLITRIPNPDDTDSASLKPFFTTELYKLQKEIRKQSIEDDFIKTGSEIEKLLQKVEVDIEDALEKLPDKSGVVRSPDYEKGINKSEINYFAPDEFIEFECMPPFLKKINHIIDDFSTNFKKVSLELSDFDQITDITLDTAVAMVNKHNSPDQIIHMFKEGTQRSLNILDHITSLSNETLNNKEEELTESFTLFVDDVKKLDDNDNILNIYSRLLKSKAIQESREQRKKIREFLKSTLSLVLTYLKKGVYGILDFYQEVRKFLKLEKAAISVSSEISNYLSDINNRIYKLPIIYRYLFESTPVKDMNMFMSRQQELEKLQKAFMDWEEGNFAATLLIGENGGGKSSLLQHFLKTNKGSRKVTYLSVSRFYYTEDDFYTLMQDLFDNESLTSDQSILDHINASSGQQVLVLDGLERIFLRKTGGFDCIQKLVSLIISTNKHAFWICSTSLHAANYLNKTISLKENFDYLIELNTLTSVEVKQIVLKRHRLSGYFVRYTEDAKQAAEAKNSNDRQQYLENEFFDELNKFANGNLSLSLYFWLESISDFSDKELMINQFKAPDFSFLQTLSAKKVYTLLLVILHGKINIDLHAQICNQAKEKSHKVLTILKEDSIVVLKDDYYYLNGILFRHVVQLLKNKNLIH